MTNNMMEKVENLRKYLEGKKLTYDQLFETLRGNENFPSMTSLRKYGLLKVVEHEETELTMTDEEASYQEYDDTDDSEEWDWDEDRHLWVYMYSVDYYGI